LITPSDSGSGTITVTAAAAPAGTGAFTLLIGQAGNRAELSVLGEWFMGGYLVGQAETWQRLARVMAYDGAAFQNQAVEATTGKIVPILNTAPAGLGPTYPTTHFGIGYPPSSNVNGGAVPYGWNGGWGYGGSTAAHMPNTMFGVWLMDGSPYLRDLLVQFANTTVADATYIPQRNPVGPLSGTQYYGQVSCVYGQAGQRVAAWKSRDLFVGLFAARQGSDEATYLSNLVNTNMDWCAEYEAYQPANWQNNGLIFNNTGFNDPSGHINTTVSPAGFEPFFMGFMATDFAWGGLIVGDRVPGMMDQVNFVAKWLVGVYNGNGGSYCTYWSMPYESGTDKVCYGAAAPGNFTSSLADVGIQNGLESVASFQDGSSTVTVTAGANPFNPLNVAGLPQVVDGDIFRTMNWSANVGPSIMSAPPSPFDCGATDYYVGNSTHAANGSIQTMTLAPTSGGTPIAAAGFTVTGVVNTAGTGYTFTTSAPHGLVTTGKDNNSKVNIAGVVSTGPGSFNGTFNVAQIATPTTFEVTNLTSPGIYISGGTATPGGVHGFFVPVNATCPPVSAGIVITNATVPENYPSYAYSALAMMTQLGVPYASTAYTNAIARPAAGGFPGYCNRQMNWCMAPP
jgi:hypothetical protein